MKPVQVHDFHDYRAFLKSHILHCTQGKHGEKSRIATAIRCHNAYLSQILAGKSDLSLEQTHDLAEYLNLALDERDYLILLVSYTRAGTKKLKDYYYSQIKEIDQRRMRFDHRIQPVNQISKEHQSVYFSDWYFAVIHLMVTTMKGYETVNSLHLALNLPVTVVQNALKFLEDAALIHRATLGYQMGKLDIFLGADASIVRAHHTHWRLQAIRSLEKQNKDEVHYSTVVTINPSDFSTIRKMIMKFLEEKRKTVAESKNESTLAALTLDWFPLVEAK